MRSSDELRDYRVFIAREVWKERWWRIHFTFWRPADFANGEEAGRDFAAELEAINDEKLVG